MSSALQPFGQILLTCPCAAGLAALESVDEQAVLYAGPGGDAAAFIRVVDAQLAPPAAELSSCVQEVRVAPTLFCIGKKTSASSRLLPGTGMNPMRQSLCRRRSAGIWVAAAPPAASARPGHGVTSSRACADAAPAHMLLIPTSHMKITPENKRLPACPAEGPGSRSHAAVHRPAGGAAAGGRAASRDCGRHRLAVRDLQIAARGALPLRMLATNFANRCRVCWLRYVCQPEGFHFSGEGVLWALGGVLTRLCAMGCIGYQADLLRPRPPLAGGRQRPSTGGHQRADGAAAGAAARGRRCGAATPVSKHNAVGGRHRRSRRQVHA